MQAVSAVIWMELEPISPVCWVSNSFYVISFWKNSEEKLNRKSQKKSQEKKNLFLIFFKHGSARTKKLCDIFLIFFLNRLNIHNQLCIALVKIPPCATAI